jgi:hypothetical protein
MTHPRPMSTPPSRRVQLAAVLFLVLLLQLAVACSPGPAVPSGSANQLEDRDAISELKARYFRFVDTKDWRRLRGLFLPDAHIDTSVDGGPVFDNAELFVGFLVNTLGSTVTVHQGHMLELDLTSPTQAAGTWELEDLLRFPIGQGVNAHGYGCYHEVYKKVDGQWKIASLRLSRLRMDIG